MSIRNIYMGYTNIFSHISLGFKDVNAHNKHIYVIYKYIIKNGRFKSEDLKFANMVPNYRRYAAEVILESHLSP